MQRNVWTAGEVPGNPYISLQILKFFNGCILFNIGPINTKLKSVSMRKPGRTRQEVIQLKLPILLKLGINVTFGE